MNCNSRQSSCTRKKAKPRQGCPDCEFTIHYKQFRKALDKELSQVKSTREQARKWSGEYLLKIVGEIAHLASLYKNTGPNWTVVTAVLVAVYRDEIAKMKSIDNWKLIQEAEEARKKAGQPTADEDEDY